MKRFAALLAAPLAVISAPASAGELENILEQVYFTHGQCESALARYWNKRHRNADRGTQAGEATPVRDQYLCVNVGRDYHTWVVWVRR